MARKLLKKTLLMSVLLAPAAGFYACKTMTPASQSPTKAQPPDRKILGKAKLYKPVASIDASELSRSMAARRQTAWEIAARLLRPVRLSSEFADQLNIDSPTLPLWQTFYEAGEIIWMFEELYDAHRSMGGNKSEDFCPEELESIFDRHAKKELSFRFPAERFQQRLGQLRNKNQVRGISGTGTTLFSPAVAMHYLMNYRQVYNCGNTYRKGLTSFQAPPSAQNHSHCFAEEFPSGRRPVFSSWQPSLAGHCKMNKDDLDQALKEALGGAVAVKTSWQQVGQNSEIAVFDTSAEALKETLESGEWMPKSYVKADSLNNDDIFTVELLTNDDRTTTKFQLTGIHFVTKDTREWNWVSLWWSPDAQEDFGADRPASGIEGPWRNYKMCTTVDYNELGDPTAGIEDRSLQDALAATHSELGPHTWCSNPFIEMGVGNARSNCIGCHQHAGADVFADDSFLYFPKTGDEAVDARNAAKMNQNEQRFPGGGRAKVRVNFPGEYLWSFSDGPDLFQSEISQSINNY